MTARKLGCSPGRKGVAARQIPDGPPGRSVEIYRVGDMMGRRLNGFISGAKGEVGQEHCLTSGTEPG